MAARATRNAGNFSGSGASQSRAWAKRAQVAVLLNERDSAARIDAARRHADRTTRELISKERLFRR